MGPMRFGLRNNKEAQSSGFPSLQVQVMCTRGSRMDVSRSGADVAQSGSLPISKLKLAASGALELWRLLPLCTRKHRAGGGSW